ncbi:MAG: hypothetical protein JWO73_774 [Candidatus Taylorbacteria bacterium]|nr:hypothetical protein [Candidatus Taylorbacteria bacterium]
MADAAIIIFIIALLGIVGMIFLKMQQLKTGQKSVLSKLGEGGDHHVHAAYDKVKFFLSHINKRTGIALMQWIAFHILSWVRNLYLRIREKAHRHPHSKKVIDMVTGRGEVSKNKGSSFYIKHIASETIKPKPQQFQAKEHVAPHSMPSAADVVAESQEK